MRPTTRARAIPRFAQYDHRTGRAPADAPAADGTVWAFHHVMMGREVRR